ncbi:MAG: class V aminotransferase [Candidatus Binatia bacterium]|nr:MAG: class V aminotransferase [Candidatus Binatia bacterium]
MIKHYLLAPGPTPVPERVLQALSRPLFHHRTPQFTRILEEVQASLKKLFGTEQDVLVLASSGTGAMEAAVTNTLSPGERALVVNGGKFGERWTRICQAYGVQVEEIRVEWGRAVDPALVEQALEKNPDIRAVLLQASETSTTVLHPVREVAEKTRRRDVLLLVDGITAVGVTELPMDRWGIDVLVTGSQKALMLPPGLAFVALSARAWKRAESARLPRFYFDLARERKALAEGTTAWTPAISLVVGLHEALTMIEEEGLERVFARHERNARATRAAARALGLELLAPDHPSPAATGIYVPGGVDGRRLVSYLRDRMGVTFAGGQDRLRGKIVRIAHLGYVGAFDVVVAVAALEMALRHFGHPIELGRGVAAAEEVLLEALPE